MALARWPVSTDAFGLVGDDFLLSSVVSVEADAALFDPAGREVAVPDALLASE